MHKGFSRGRLDGLVFPSLWEFSAVCCDPHTVKGCSIVSEADVFLAVPCFLYDPTNVGSLISGSSAFSKPSLYIWKFSVHLLLKPNLKYFEHYTASMWNEQDCAVVWAFFGIAFFWDWNENWPFPVLWPLLSFPNISNICWHIECSTLIALSFRIWNNSTEIPSPSLALFVVMRPPLDFTFQDVWL